MSRVVCAIVVLVVCQPATISTASRRLVAYRGKRFRLLLIITAANFTFEMLNGSVEELWQEDLWNTSWGHPSTSSDHSFIENHNFILPISN